MVASDTIAFNDYYIPSQIRPRHRRDSQVLDTTEESINDVNSAEAKRASRNIRIQSIKSNDIFKKSLKVARVLVCLILLVIIAKKKSSEFNRNFGEIDITTDYRQNYGSREHLERNSHIFEPTELKSNTVIRRMRIRSKSQLGVELPRNKRKPPPQGIELSTSISIPKNLDLTLQDLSKPIQEGEVPFFWHILKSGGTTIKDAIGMCLGKVEATGSGVLDGHGSDSQLKKVRISNGTIEYANVDTTTLDGIARAVSFDLIENEIVDVVFSPLLHESTKLFKVDSEHKGRAFCLFRHPLERAVSLFHYLKHASWEPTFSDKLVSIKSVQDYAVSEFAENNWMVRFLTNEMKGILTRDHLDVAKEILKRKVLVGLTSDMKTSFERFMTYFGWNKDPLSVDQEHCITKYLSNGSNRNEYMPLEQDSEGWKLLKRNNNLDLELYDFVLQLYKEQGQNFDQNLMI